MNSINYLYRSPLLNAKQHVLGYRLARQDEPKCSDSFTAENLRQLLTLNADATEKTGSERFFLEAGTVVLSAELLQSLRPKNTVLMLNQDDMVNAGNLPLLISLHARGFGLALCDVDLALLEASDELLSLVTHIELDVDEPNLTEIADYVRQARPELSVHVKKVLNWQEFEGCAARGVSAFFENLCLRPRQLNQSAEISPQTALVVQLMQMLYDDADIRDLEKVLQRDAMLSYKLFRYMNSASFGLNVEIESLRHAVTMLGYMPLYRWLSLLLVMTNTAGFSPALLQAAIVRGRFIELLGQNMLSQSEAENLFVVGLFSLLDQLLGVSIHQVLRQISLPTVIVEALLAREGVYGPFLALAEACEHENGLASEIADSLFLNAAQVNQAHLSALVWAQNFEI